MFGLLTLFRWSDSGCTSPLRTEGRLEREQEPAPELHPWDFQKSAEDLLLQEDTPAYTFPGPACNSGWAWFSDGLNMPNITDTYKQAFCCHLFRHSPKLFLQKAGSSWSSKKSEDRLFNILCRWKGDTLPDVKRHGFCPRHFWHSLGQVSILCIFVTSAVPFLFHLLVRCLNQQPIGCFYHFQEGFWQKTGRNSVQTRNTPKALWICFQIMVCMGLARVNSDI